MGIVAKKMERTMPTIPDRIRPLRRWAQALVLGALVGSASAASRYSLVIDGKIVSVDALDSKAGKLPSLDALAELAKALPGASLSADASAGVISISRAGGGSIASLGGFKQGPLTIVVDGKIQKSSCKTAGAAA